MAWAAERKPAQDVDEADMVRWDSTIFGTVDDDDSNCVVDDAKHGKLSIDSFNGLATQDVHLHRGLEVTQVCLDLPSATVEFGNGVFGVAFGIKQRRDERHFP